MLLGGPLLLELAQLLGSRLVALGHRTRVTRSACSLRISEFTLLDLCVWVYEHTFVPVACAIVPRFQLLAAVERRETLAMPAALAPEPGAAQLVGEVSGPAEQLGVRPGMRVGEALSRCPELALVPPDPERAERSWEIVLRRLEGVGAEVESDRAGEVFFEAGGLRALWGGTEGVLARARREVGTAALLAAAPGRFCAYAAARQDGGFTVVPEESTRRFLAPLRVSLLHGRLPDGDDLPNELERLGIDTLGRLAELPRDAVADRLGTLGLAALRLARGEDEPLRPRHMHEALAVELELPEAASGQQLERALELLIGRLLAHRGRRGRALRALRLSARLAAGGGWRRQVALRRAGTERDRITAVLLPQLALLPAPATTLRLEAVELGAAGGEQLALSAPEEQRRRRIAEAVRQARAAGGSEAVLRVLEVDPESRVPERRDVLMPFPEESP
jgi:protein ImuB